MASKINIISPINNKNETLFFNIKSLYKKASVTKESIWSDHDQINSFVKTNEKWLNLPIIDLEVMKGSDEAAIAAAAEIVRDACMRHGFFLVSNHGVDQNLIKDTYQEFDNIFKLPLIRKVGSMRHPWGYSGAHAWQFSSKLPWKEAFTFQYKHYDESDSQIVDFFKSVLGDDHQHAGLVCQKYCDAMKELSGVILELLAISLGVDRLYYKKFFKDAETMMRCNSYPCDGFQAGTLGTGPHSDPTSVTILYQDQVGGLEVFVDNKWLAIPPQPNTFAINIGDTFMALTNGIYKSCLHRVLPNKEETGIKTLAFLLSPKADKIVRAPNNLLGREEARKYPDFTWSQFFEFTQKQYKAGPDTLPKFISWLCSFNPSKI